VETIDGFHTTKPILIRGRLVMASETVFSLLFLFLKEIKGGL
jgi:hypothetical protein